MERAAIITGGSSGIGLAIARMLRDEGFDLTLASRRAEKVEAAAEELGAAAVVEPAGGLVDRHEAAVGVEHGDDVHRRVENGLEVGLHPSRAA